MIKNIIKYPQPPSLEFNAPVRGVDKNIKQIIQDLKDTITHNNLIALSAYEIGSPFAIIVLKQDDN